jgi:hypothetical protein
LTRSIWSSGLRARISIWRLLRSVSTIESLRVAFPAACGAHRSHSEPEVLCTGHGAGIVYYLDASNMETLNAERLRQNYQEIAMS